MRRSTTKTKRNGLLIALEGIDGSGKSSIAKLLQEWLLESGYTALFRCEPTELQYGLKLRDSFTTGNRLSPEEELDLFFRDRLEHVEKIILPALDQGAVVIIDRYYYSSMAYQGVRGYKTPDEIFSLMKEIAPVPDLTLLLNVEIETALQRIENGRGEIPNVMEKRNNLALVKKVFDEMDFAEIIRIDSSKPIEVVFQNAKRIVQPFLSRLYTAQ